MKSMLHRFHGMRKNECGQGMVEYALIIALVAVALVLALATLGRQLGWWGYLKGCRSAVRCSWDNSGYIRRGGAR